MSQSQETSPQKAEGQPKLQSSKEQKVNLMEEYEKLISESEKLAAFSDDNDISGGEGNDDPNNAEYKNSALPEGDENAPVDDEDALGLYKKKNMRTRGMLDEVKKKEREFQDVEQVYQELGDFATRFRTDVMSKLFEVKKRVSERYEDIIKQMDEDEAVTALQTRNAILKLKESISKRDFFLRKFKTTTDKMVDRLGKLAASKDKKRLMGTAFNNWKKFSTNSKRLIDQSTMRNKFNDKELLRKLFYGWRTFVFNEKFHSNNIMWESKLQLEKAQLENDYKHQNSVLLQDLEQMKANYSQSEQEKRMLQEKLKKGLMRGVCALNNKFLEIIKDTNEANTHFEETDFQQDGDSQSDGEGQEDQEAEAEQPQNEEIEKPQPLPGPKSSSNSAISQKAYPHLSRLLANLNVGQNSSQMNLMNNINSNNSSSTSLLDAQPMKTIHNVDFNKLGPSTLMSSNIKSPTEAFSTHISAAQLSQPNPKVFVKREENPNATKKFTRHPAFVKKK